MVETKILDPNIPIKEQLDIIEENIIGELKDFQKATVERIDELFRNGQNRVLISDEVGLGKTLIARGTIAKFAKLRKEENDDLVKVVYICSNGAVAGQNLEKLKINNDISVEDSNTSRLSMQHLNIFKQEYDGNILESYIQLISLTPKTSFSIHNSNGTVDERALMYVILKRLDLDKEIINEINRIFKKPGPKSWTYAVKWFEDEFNHCNKKSNGKYEEHMVKELNKTLKTKSFKDKILIDYITDYCLSNNKTNKESRELIVELRTIFADISLNKLEPDLIIMDEFQRFKYLINSDKNSEMKKLTDKFFNNKSTRILMLSATPYKMYSTIDEIDYSQVDAHYSEFLDVMNFLNIEEDKKEEFKEIWSNYSIHLKEIKNEDISIISAKRDAENALYNTICRTERITESEMGDLIDDSNVRESLKVFKEDIKSYIEVQKLLDSIDINTNVPIDYIKSTPYIMSFMKNYKLKTKLEKYFEKHPNEIRKMNKKTFWIVENRINNYKPITNNNARLNHLMNYVFKNNSENLLWIPPSKQYYPSEGVFKNSENTSKTILFSSWEMVPRMISTLVSYESERRTTGKIVKNNPKLNYYNLTKKVRSRMRFESDKEKPRTMNLLGLVYASEFLSETYNPIDCLNRNLTLREIEKEIKSKINDKLKIIEDKYYEKTNRDDYRWYYIAPLLLDSLISKDLVNNWFENIEEYVDRTRDDYNQFIKHINALKETFDNIYNKKEKLGKKPADLINILSNIAIASPANCIYRSFKKESQIENDKLRKLAIRPSRSFMKYMGQIQSISIVELSYTSKSKVPYWKKALKYSKQGNIQAMFDEFIHLLSNGLDKNNDKRICNIYNKLIDSMELRSTAYDYDTYPFFSKRVTTGDKNTKHLRTHFAVSFTKGKGDEQDIDRKKSVRDAFNSPFRPFVLASTSIGQEGLDFHNYCRRIVHWNLPSNPIDLEQREGRINRFECLAIRQNIAKRYGNISFKKDIWKEMLNEASNTEKDNKCSDLIPFWGLKESEDMIKIERIVPMYPFSLDEKKYERLIKILSLYRLTLGQARQEELLEYIFDNNLENNKLNDLFINLSPYYKNILNENNMTLEKQNIKNY